MAYAKKCKYCNTVQVVWNDKLDGPNKFMEVETNLQHSRDRCDAAKNTPVEQQVPMYNPQEQRQFVDYYRPTLNQSTESFSPSKQSETIAPKDYQAGAIQLAQLLTKVDNINIGLAKVMSMIQTLNDLSMNAEDISRLRTENAELKDVLKNREDNFVPANQVPQQSEMTAEHVQRMVRKGQEDEELEI